jgi:hypothetical protein
MSHIVESSAKLAKAGSRWKAVLITPGKGSSGIYSEEMLRSTGPSAFPAGTHSYIDHSEDGRRKRARSVRRSGRGCEYEEGVGLVGVLEVMPHYAEFANAVAPHTGLSISAAAEKSKDANGEIIIESLIPNRMNSVDLVSYAGRGGAMAEKLLEAARSSFTTSSNVIEDSGTAPADDRNHNGKEKISKMEIEELATRVDTIAESLEKLAAVVTPLAESLAAEQEKAAKEAEEAKKAPELDFAPSRRLPSRLTSPLLLGRSFMSRSDSVVPMSRPRSRSRRSSSRTSRSRSRSTSTCARSSWARMT